jgi:long-chain acyl-CoA synthetase
MVLGLLVGLLAAATVVLLDDPDPATLARAIERERPTVLPVGSERLPGLLDEGDAAKRDLRSLRVILAVGGPVDRQLATDVERRTGGARVREGFGSAETGTLTHAQPVYGRAEWGTMGLPVTDVVAAVVDPDAPGTVLGPGSVGRLLVRGPQTARGYWKRPAATAGRVVDGWVLSDDLVSMDPDGVFRHLGPRDEVLERPDGFVAPRHVEAVLERHPGVRRAGVVDSDDGQRLLAAVIVRRRHRPDADELLVHCREHLDPPAVPDEVALVDELPETDAGALARETLRERLAGAGDGAS